MTIRKHAGMYGLFWNHFYATLCFICSELDSSFSWSPVASFVHRVRLLLCSLFRRAWILQRYCYQFQIFTKYICMNSLPSVHHALLRIKGISLGSLKEPTYAFGHHVLAVTLSTRFCLFSTGGNFPIWILISASVRVGGGKIKRKKEK